MRICSRMSSPTAQLAWQERVIVPLDVSSRAAAIALLDRLPEVRFWKVGLELFVSSGPEILTDLKQRQCRIFLDLKFHDIPNTMAAACRAAVTYGVDLITVHAAAGRAALSQVQQVAQQQAATIGLPAPRLIAVTLLTSLSDRDLALDLKNSLELPEYVLHLALLTQESGLAGVVCSPREVREIRRVCGPDFVLVCPGVRPTWAPSSDQQRTLTPAEAIQAGADYLVIGRPITAAGDPAAAWAQIGSELSSGKLE